MKKIFILFLALVLALSLVACGWEDWEDWEDTGDAWDAWDTWDTRDTQERGSRPAYETVSGRTSRHKKASPHANATATGLERALEDAYGFDLVLNSFTESEITTFYKRYGYDGLPDNRDDYIMNALENIERLFPAIPIEIVQFMDEAVNLTIYISIDTGDEADGLYYADSNSIHLMYEGTAIIHEYGHMLHYALLAITGEEAFEREWTALNNGIAYNDGRGGTGVYDYDSGRGAANAVFYGDYATTDIFEDVAETFWMMIERPEDLNKFINAGAPLAKKAALLDRLLRETLLTADPDIIAEAFATYAMEEYWAGEGGATGWDWDDWYDEGWWSWGAYENDADGDGYCDDCGEWLGHGSYDDWDWDYDDDWDDRYNPYDLDGDGYCDDCGEWLG